MNLRDEKGGARDRLQDLDAPCVLIADELTPSVVAQLDWTRIKGFATDAGSRTYHTGDPRAFARRAGGRRPARREPSCSAWRVRDHRRRNRRGGHRSDAGALAGSRRTRDAPRG